MNHSPTKLELVGSDRLRIHWTDNQVREYRFRELRDACPCATCREKKGEPHMALPTGAPPPLVLPIVTAAEVAPLKITAMNPVGNYAYSIAFSDGHDSGIFTLDLLRTLGESVKT